MMTNLGNFGIGIYQMLKFFGDLKSGTDNEKVLHGEIKSLFWQAVKKGLEDYNNPPAM